MTAPVLPESGEGPGWGTKVNDAIEALYADTQTAVSNADTARSTAIDARMTAESVREFVEGPTDAQIAAKVAEDESASADAVDDRIDTKVPSASATTQGKVELATSAEVTTGTDTARAVTPAGVKAVLDPIRDLSDETFATNLSASYAAIFTPESKGAAGDGATDDTTAIQQAIAAAQAFASRGIVKFADGKTYIVSGALDFAGVTVDGEGATLKVKGGTTPTYSVVDLTAACVIEGLTIDLNKANTTDPGNQLHGNGILMNATSWDGLAIRNVTVRNGHQIGVHIYGPGASNADDVTYCRTFLDGVTVESCDEASFSIKTVQGVTISNCRSVDAGGASFYLSVVGQSSIRGCQSTGGAGSGFFLEYCQDVVVSDNLAADNTMQGIAIGGGSDTLRENRNITVTGNVCRNNGSIGITVDPTKAAALQTWVAVYSTVSNNLCEGNGGTGINLENAAYVAVNGNVCHGNTGTGLRILGAYVNASGNVLTSNTQYGLAIYGVSGHDNGHHRFGGNTAIGNTVGQFDWNAITLGTVADVITRHPGSVRAQTTVHGAADTTQETYIGATGPGGQAGLKMYDIDFYRSSAFLAVLSQALRLDGAAIYFGSAGDTVLSRTAANEASMGSGDSLKVDGTWNGGRLRLGSYHLWVDAAGALRIKSSAPASDTDGTVVGTQT